MEAHALLKGRLNMTLAKAAALTAGFLGAFAVGVAVGPSVQDRLSVESTRAAVPPAETTATKASPQTAASTAPAKTPRARTTAAARETAPSNAVKANAASSSVPLSEPRLHARLKPVLNRGARMDVAAEGFRSAEEFATVAHAARNTEVPFMVLKHRVLIDKRTLADAIHESKPEVDAKAEVARAVAAAKSDIATVGG
jgi:hypothetical protein